MLFITSDEAEEAGRVVDPVMNVWSVGDVPLQDYRAVGFRLGALACGRALEGPDS